MLAWDHNRHYHRLLLGEVPDRCERVLEIGCGTGELSSAIAARATRVDAVDRAPEMIARARTRVPDNVTLILADIDSIDLPPNRYDAVLSVAVLHHLVLTRVLPRLAETLRPGGVLAAIGIPRSELPRDLPAEIAATVLHHAAGVLRWAGGRPVGARFLAGPDRAAMPVAHPNLTVRQAGAVASALLPGASVRRLMLWRYLLVWRKPAPVWPVRPGGRTTP